MNTRKDDKKNPRRTPFKGDSHGRIVAAPNKDQGLDTVQLNQLELCFRNWAEDSVRIDVRLARRRILIIFLLIRYTGAKLNEVLALNPFMDIDIERCAVFFRDSEHAPAASREVQISEALAGEIAATLADPAFKDTLRNLFDVDPGFVRRKFYECAQVCGFPKRLGGPEMIRKARAVEMMRGSMPLPAVQMILGHSTPNLTSAYVSFSREEISRMARLFMERESSRKTSARNSFFGKIVAILRGDIQTRVVLATLGGHALTTIITNDSLERLGLEEGRLVTAEVKAPWLILHAGTEEPTCSAENRYRGIVARITAGRINAEYAVHLSDGTELCAVISSESSRRLGLHEGDAVWVLFNGYAVVLQVD
jgi:molybdate transport system regulatory protein